MTRTDDTMTSRLGGGPGKVNLHLNTWQVFLKKYFGHERPYYIKRNSAYRCRESVIFHILKISRSMRSYGKECVSNLARNVLSTRAQS